MIKGRIFILIGDQNQLPPIFEEAVTENLLKRNHQRDNIKKTIFEDLYERLYESRKDFCHFLEFNYRMHPSIGELISQLFYKNQLKTPTQLKESKKHDLKYESEVIWLSTENMANKNEKKVGTSFINKCNIKAIIDELILINEQYKKKNFLNKTVGIISPYKSQIKHLNNQVKPYDEKWSHLTIDIATVDSFQGSDRDIIIFDTVRSNVQKKLGFITDIKRLNVALSRAKELLIIIGDADCIYQGGFTSQEENPYKILINSIRSNSKKYSFKKLENRNEK